MFTPALNTTKIPSLSKPSFSNYIQSFVADNADERIRPADLMWEEAKQAFPEVLYYTKPDAVLILGIEMANRIPNISSSIKYHSIKHPSQFLKYSDWKSGVQTFLSTATGAV